MSKMKMIFENLRKALNEEEQPPDAKANIMTQAAKEVDAIVGRAKTAAQDDDGLAREVIESIIRGLQEQLGKL
tara:strand:- start:215 stop:433 length:219 start_codon:yes stop_codon:yes gene_type:complete